MSHVFEVEDEEYTRLEQIARQQGSTAEALFRTWIRGVTNVREQEVREARARWAALALSEASPSDEDLRAHPLLRVVGIGAVHEPGWADRHDAVFGESEDPEKHDDK